MDADADADDGEIGALTPRYSAPQRQRLPGSGRWPACALRRHVIADRLAAAGTQVIEPVRGEQLVLQVDDGALVLQADVPGVKKDDVEINLDKDVLTISGRVALDEYEGLRPVYSEFGVGNFYRRFSLGETIDQAAITADMNDGVLTVTLPKREKAQPRKITVT